MACLESPDVCEYVVHAGAELAEELGAPLFVVHVAPPPPSIGAEETGVQPALTMAERLGAGVVTIRASDRGAGLSAFAQREGITHAVFGPEAQRSSSWRRSTLATFAEEQPGASTMVVRVPGRERVGRAGGAAEVRHVVLEAGAAQLGQSRWRRPFAVAAGVGVVGLSGAAILLLPAIVGFSVALAVALLWTRWLEREHASQVHLNSHCEPSK